MAATSLKPIDTDTRTCRFGLDINQKCLDSCKISRIKRERAIDYSCLAADKIENFMLNGGFNFQIALKAFQTAPKEVLEEFLEKEESHAELFSYLLKIDLPESAAIRANSLSEKSLYKILNSSFDSYLMIRDEQAVENYQKDFFSVAHNHFWRKIPIDKIFSLLSYCIRTADDMKISGLLLMLLDVDNLIKLKDVLKLSDEEILRLYCSILDEINVLIKTYPHLYTHLLEVFKDYPDYLGIFKDFESDVLKIQRVNDFIERFIEKYKNERDQVGLLQRLHTELNGLKLEEIKSILTKIMERGVINQSQANMMIEFFTYGNFKFMEKVEKNHKKFELQNSNPILSKSIMKK